MGKFRSLENDEFNKIVGMRSPFHIIAIKFYANRNCDCFCIIKSKFRPYQWRANARAEYNV